MEFAPVKCPICSFEDTKVLESRLSHEGRAIRRRRSCLKCGHRFTTYEKLEDLVLQVKKKDERFEPYQRDKVLRSIQTACQKRPINIDEIESILAEIERKLQEDGERTISSHRIGDLIMEHLRRLDHVAYVRFASVYKDFKDADEFVAELTNLRNREAPAPASKKPATDPPKQVR